MGTSLFNTTPAATYPALLKVGDNSTIGTTLKTISDGSGNDSTLQLSTRRLGILQDSGVTTQASSVIQATTTNANLVIAPNGTGALVASIPDGTATGGDLRGNNAVDLQMVRNAANQVASGLLSFIGGGEQNRASQAYNLVVGGYINVANTGAYSAVVGGRNNTTSANYCFAGGGLQNQALSDFSTVSGGQSNTASTGTHATVVGGQSNVSSGQYSVSGGFTNTASGFSSVAMGDNNTASGFRSVAMGRGNTASGNNSVALGGEGSVASGNSSFAIGFAGTASAEYSHVMGFGNVALARRSFALGGGASAYLTGQLSLSQEKWGIGGAANGNAQQSLLTAKREDILTTAATTVLSLDGTGTTNLIIPEGNNRMWNVQVRWVAVVTAITGTATGVTVGDTKASTDLLAVAKRSGTTTVSAHTSAGTHAIETIAGSLTAANIAYTAGASKEMAITFTGPTFAGGGSVTMRVVAAISLTEVAY